VSTRGLKAVGEISAQAMPFTLASIATSNAATISETTESVEPTQWAVGMPRMLQASAIPYRQPTKNESGRGRGSRR